MRKNIRKGLPADHKPTIDTIKSEENTVDRCLCCIFNFTKIRTINAVVDWSLMILGRMLRDWTTTTLVVRIILDCAGNASGDYFAMIATGYWEY
jgi:hypothetical protein